MSEGSNPKTDGQSGQSSEALAFDIDEQPPITRQHRAPFERIEMVVTGFPKPETRRLPFAQRLRVLLHGQIPRGARR